MSLRCTVGGAQGTFPGDMGQEVAQLLDHAFGAELAWDDQEHRRFGELESTDWSDFQQRALAELGTEALPNLLALRSGGQAVYLPANVQTLELPLSDGRPLLCGSLTGLRCELLELADTWDIPVNDERLLEILESDKGEEEIQIFGTPEVISLARLVLAANEAMRRDCPLWLIG